MKLYIWEKCVFENYGMGIAIALADSLEQARKQFSYDPDGYMDKPNPKHVKPTKIIDCDKRKSPYSVYMIGSD